MKTIFFFLSLLLLSTTLPAQRDQFTVQVDGLGCPFCAYGLEANFKEVPAITKIKIDLEGGILRFETPTANALSIAKVQEQVTNSGYTARKIEVLRADGKTEVQEFAASPTKEMAMDDSKGASAGKQIVVGGKCAMCKERIEATALGVKGVKAAEWEASTQTLSLQFDPEMGNATAVQHALAQAGHDTPIAKSSKKTYKALPACCHYR